MKKEISIKGKRIGGGLPVYVIAEMSANHCGEFEQAVKIIHAAKEAGADAIKLQTYTPDTMTIDCRKVDFLVGKGTLWEGAISTSCTAKLLLRGSGSPNCSKLQKV